MSDLVFLLVTVGFFALAVGFVHVCDRIVGRGEPAPPTERAPDLAAVTSSSVGRES